MTDGEAFLLVIVLIYLSDCLVWLPPGACALVRYWRSGFLVKRAAVNFEALRKGFAVLNPLPPFGDVFVAEAWPVSLSGEGIAPCSRENPNPGSAIGALPGTTALAWEAATRIEAREHALWINGHRYAWCATRHAATLLARELRNLRDLPAAARADAIDRLVRRRFRERDAARRAAFFRRATTPMRRSAGLLFAGVFLVLPAAYWRFHDEPRFFVVLLAVWLLMLGIAIDFLRLHRRFYPGLSMERWQHFLFALFFPHLTIRSLDILSKGFLAGFHPLALATALAKPGERDRLARSLARDARHPIPLRDDGAVSRIARQFHDRHFRPALEAALARLPQPGPAVPHAGADADLPRAECPRCGTPYEATGLPCIDCAGIPTVSRPA